MNEALFAVWLAIIGVLVLAPAAQRIPSYGAALLAPTAGTALTILVGLATVAGSVFSLRSVIVLSTLVALAVVLHGPVRRSVPRRWLIQASGIAAAIGLLVAAIAWTVPTVRFTTDSFHHMMSATVLVRSGSLEGVTDLFLLKRQFATPFLHTLGVEAGRGYTAFWSPLLGVSVFASMTWLAFDAMKAMLVPRRWRWSILVPILLFTLTANRVAYHFAYINGHMLFAALLLGAVGLGWLAVRTLDWPILVPSSLLFAALIPLRAESALVVGGFLVVFISSELIPLQWRWALLGPTLVSILVWDGWVVPRTLSAISLETMKSPLSEIAVATGLLLIIILSSIPVLTSLTEAAPWFAIGGLAALLIVLVATDPGTFLDSSYAVLTNVLGPGLWGTYWVFVLPVLFAAVAIGFPDSKYLFTGLWAFALIIPILAYLRGGVYSVHAGDSANRMAMHVVPVIMLTIALAGGTAVRAVLSSVPSVDEPLPPESQQAG